MRYWDGQQWTEHRTQPHATQSAAPIAPARRGWFARHPKTTAGLALLVALWFIGTVAGEDEPEQVATDTAAAEADDDLEELLTDSETPAPAEAAADDADDADAAEEAAETSKPKPKPKPKRPTWVVSEVVDGDTVKLTNGETVRVVGIDTPERGECGFDEATLALERLVLGRRVNLVMSDEDRDRYGRLLRYVDVAGQDAGLRLIQAGFAIARYDSRDGYGFHPREPKYIAADKASKNLCPPKTPEPKPVPLVQTPNGGGGGGACAPGYDPCVPPYPPDVNCPDVNGPIRVTGDDPHGLDRDGDGIACES